MRLWVDVSQIIANIVIVVALGLSAAALIDQTHQGRRDAAALRVETFYSEELVHAQSVLFRLWVDKDLSPLSAGLSRTDMNILVEKTIEAADQPKVDVWGAIVTLTSFYDGIEYCVTDGPCDPVEIERQIGGYGRSLHCTYLGEIEALRSRLLIDGLGNGLASFTERMGGCDG